MQSGTITQSVRVEVTYMTRINGSNVYWGVELETGYADKLPFERELDRIYRAYRTCYSKEPWKDPEISTTKQTELLDAYRQHRWYVESFWDTFGKNRKDPKKDYDTSKYESVHQKVNNHVTNLLDQFGIEAITEWLFHADFIKKHMRHESALEHATFTFTFTDCSRSFTHQLVRHRLTAISHQSQRWCSETDPEFVVPTHIADNPEARKIFAQYVNQLPNIISSLKELGMSNEDCRSLFPNAIKTRLVMTANWREWIHIWNERRCGRASEEMQGIMNNAYELVIDQVPFIFDDVTPKCRSFGRCPEEKCCGNQVV